MNNCTFCRKVLHSIVQTNAFLATLVALHPALHIIGLFGGSVRVLDKCSFEARELVSAELVDQIGQHM